MLLTLVDCIEIIRCPKTRSRLKTCGDGRLVTAGGDAAHGEEYRVVNGKPILIDFADSVFSKDLYFNGRGQSAVKRQRFTGGKKLIKNLLSPTKKSTVENFARLVADLEKLDRPARVLIIGGGTVGQGMEPLYAHPQIQICSFDVYDSPNIQFVADAHHIPLVDEYFDAVVIQAVLEHVLQPHVVVAEIWRVLRPDGLVYAETPFMQQVHEGPYDFTRFTESGHRYLFRHFQQIASGANGGPGIQFMWAMDFLARGVFRSVTAGKIAKLMFFWTQYLDALIPPDYAADGASGVFFYGMKSQTSIMPLDIIEHYQGAQRPN